MSRQSLRSFRQTITVRWPQQAKANGKALLLRTARDGHARIMAEQSARGGVRPEFEAYANRPGNANLDSVVLPGPIVYRYRYVREIVQFALDALRKASPVISGDYARSHALFVNGAPVDVLPVNLKPSDEIFIANPVPYARRLEIGKTTAGRNFVLQVPNRIYERVAKNVVTPRFRNIAKVTFGYVSIPNAHAIKGGLPSHYATGRVGPRGGGTRRKRRQAIGAQVRAPAIFISLLN